MRIERIEVVAVRVSPPPEQAALRALRGEWILVAIHSEIGLAGYGEATHSGDDQAVSALIRQAGARHLAGWELSLDGEPQLARHGVRPRPAAHWLETVFAPGGGRVAATALSAMEQALWDLAARGAGRPLHVALAQPGERRAAGAPAAVPLYATLNRGIFDRTPEGFAAAARRAVAEGFRAVKCAPFDGVARGGGPSAEREAAVAVGLERVAAVREAIGAAVELMVDCHGRFSEGEAVQVARRLEPFRLRWLEEPVPFDPDPAPLARVRRMAPMPIAAGELLFGVEGFRPLLEHGAADVIMPDVKHCGGLAAAHAIAGLAADYGVAVAPHNPSGPLSTLASAHLCAALANAPLLEYAWGEVPWRASLLRPPERVAGGALHLPAGPGLGAAVDGTVLAARRAEG